MELLNLRCSNKQDNLSKHQILKFSYQWHVINLLGMKSHSFDLSHSLSKKFTQSAYDLGIELPDEIAEKLCIRCSALLLPGISSSIRIKKCNKSKQRKNKLKQNIGNNQCDGIYKNEVHIRCHTCGLIGQKMEGCKKTNTTSKSDSSSNDKSILTSNNTINKIKPSQIVENKKSKKKNTFSFMNRIKGSSPSKSSLSSSSSSSSSTTTATTKTKGVVHKASRTIESFKKASLPSTGLGTLSSLFRNSSS